MRVLKITCPGCAAQMLIDYGNKRAYCEFCGTVVALEEKEIDQVKNIVSADTDLEIYAGIDQEYWKETRTEEDILSEIKELREELKEKELRLSELEEEVGRNRQEDEFFPMAFQDEDYVNDGDDTDDEDEDEIDVEELSETTNYYTKKTLLCLTVIIIGVILLAIIKAI